MIATTVHSKKPRSVARPQAPSHLASVAPGTTYRILLAEHRDEVFARLEGDLREMGHSVFRVMRSDELARLYAHLIPDLVLCHHELSGDSGWITAAKLRMCYTTARVWLYSPWKSTFDPTWVKMSGIESVIYYRGDLFRLACEVVNRIRNARLEPRRIGRYALQRKPGLSRLRTG